MNYSFNGSSVIKEPNSGINITTLSNFSINNGSNYNEYKGMYFPVKYYAPYNNMLDYYIGGYLQLKKIYPELKIIFFKSSKALSSIVNPINKLVVKDFIKYFNAEVLDVDVNSYFFDSIVVNDPENPVVPYELYTDTNPVPKEFDKKTIAWRLNSTIAVFNEFKHMLIKNETKDIYVTRSFINKKFLTRIDRWSEYRKHDPLYDEYLDNLFKTNNFNVIEFFDMGFFEQINIAYNANTYIVIDGSSIFNAIWCRDDCKIIIIRINEKYTKYNYYWDDVLKSVGVNTSKIIDISSINVKDIDTIFKNLLDW